MRNQLLRLVFVATVFLGSFTFWLIRAESLAQPHVPTLKGNAP
jgi:hypothetical protein